MKNVVIVGGGASGLIASIMVKKELGSDVKVIILERLDRVGKKLLATGNGRCNFSNELMSDNKYNNPDFVHYLLKRFGYTETLDFFEELGLMSKVLTEGRVYPITENASSVLDVLRLMIEELGIEVRTSVEVKKINSVNDQYLLESSRGEVVMADYVILAVGGMSSPVLGSNGSGYNLLKNFKIEIVKPIPGLVGLKVDNNAFKSLDGIRVKCNVIIKDKKTKKVYWSELGEALFKSDGLSGIVSMQASTYLNRRRDSYNKYIISLDLLPNMSSEELIKYFEKKQKIYGNQTVEILFVGLINKMIGYKILKDCKIDLNCLISELKIKDINKIIENIKNFILDIKGTYDFDKSQVTIGGVSVNEVKKETLELKTLPKVYITGELLDIDGECGGYNLQWAWTSGYVAGSDIVKKIRGKNNDKDR